MLSNPWSLCSILIPTYDSQTVSIYQKINIMNRLNLMTTIIICQLLAFKPINAQVTSLPLIQIDDLVYQGGFIIPSSEYGESNANYTTGTIEYNNSNQSLFLSGFDLHGAIAEFSIPTLVNSTDLTELNTATILQNFRKVLNQTSDNNPQNIDRITGMKLINNKLMVNALEFYDAPADNTHTTLILENSADIANTAVSGYYSLTGAAHTAGWISPIPTEWQILLEGDYISGNSSRYAINSRLPMGISAFVFNSTDLSNPTSIPIPTTSLLDFDLNNPLYAAYNSYENPNYNLVEVNGTTNTAHTFADADATVGANNLWTEESEASYGFIVPGSRTYLTIGSSGGHNSGIGYKATQNNGYECPGPCSYDADDYYNYYWLWDVNDFLEVKNGTLNPNEVRPYSYGVFDSPFQTDAYSNTPEFHPISGGTYDPESGLLYLSIYDGASIDSPYDRNPVIVAYKINENVVSEIEEDINLVVLSPNPSSDYITISLKNNTLERIVIYDEIGQFIKESRTNKVDVSELSPGIYIVNTILQNGKQVFNKLIVQ
jgi:hypothetical protein